MRHCPIMATALLFATVGSGPALAAGAAAAGIATCSFAAITNHKGPHGLNIRAGPGTGYAVIGRIPPPGDGFSGEVDVSGSKDGWFRIDDAMMPDADYDPGEVVFHGEGWVSGRYLYAWIEKPYLYGGPSTHKPVVVDLSKPGPDGEAGGDTFQVEHFYACLGSWAEVGGDYSGRQVRGWTYSLCPSQVTTCGGIGMPNPE